MGVLDTLQPLTNQDTAAPPVGANTTTPDGAPPSWSTAAAASFRSAIDETPFVQQTRIGDAYVGLAGQVAKATGKTTRDYELPIWTQGTNALNPWGQSDPVDRDALWRDIARLNASGTPINGVTNQQEFESHVLTRGGSHQADAALAAQGGLTANLAGGLAAMPASPANMAAGVIGGPELPEVAQVVLGKTLSGMASAGITNMGVTAALEPSSIDARARLGETTTAGDVATDIGTAGAFGAALHGAGALVQRFVGAVPPIYRTPVEQAAVNVLEHNAEVETANPFPNSTAAMDLHKQRLAEATADLDAGRLPGASPGFAPVARQGPSPDYFAKLGQVESSNNPLAQARTSSAGGLYQFTDQTFLTLYKKRIGADGQSDQAILAHKFDPAVQDTLIRDMTAQNSAYLARHGRPIDDGSLYLAHFAGPDGAVKVLEADPAARAIDVLGARVVKANPFLADMNAGDVRAWAERKMGGVGDRAGMVATSDAGGGADVGSDIGPGEDMQGIAEAQAESPSEGQTAGSLVQGVDEPAATDAGTSAAAVSSADRAPRAMASEAEAPLSVQVLLPGLRAAIRDPSIKMNDIAGLADVLDAHPDDVRAGLQQLVTSGALVQRGDNGAFVRPPPGRDLSLIESIQKGGGIWDGDGGEFKGGDLAAMGLDDWYKGGRFRSKAPIIRAAEMGHGDRGADKVLRSAIEDGYFPELRAAYDAAGPSTLDTNDLHTAIAEELAGRPRYPVGSRSYERQVRSKPDPSWQPAVGDVPRTTPAGGADFAISHLPDQLHEDMSLAATFYGRALDKFDPWIIDHAHNLATRHGIDGAAALDRAVNDYARINTDEALAETGKNDYDKIDYDADPFAWPADTTDRRKGGTAAPDRGRQDAAGGAEAAGEPRGRITGRAGDAQRDAAIAAGIEPPPHVDSAALAQFDDPDSAGVAAMADSAWHDVLADAGIKDPAIAAREAEQAKLGAAAPLRGENKTGQAQDGTMGLGLFDTADSRMFDLGDGQGPRSVADIAAEFDGDQAAVDAIQDCLK